MEDTIKKMTEFFASIPESTDFETVCARAGQSKPAFAAAYYQPEKMPSSLEIVDPLENYSPVRCKPARDSFLVEYKNAKENRIYRLFNFHPCGVSR